MKFMIEVPDNIRTGKALAGTLYVAVDKSMATWRQFGGRTEKVKSPYMKTAHGKISHGVEKTRVTMTIAHDEDIDEPESIYNEAWDMRSWLRKHLASPSPSKGRES